MSFRPITDWCKHKALFFDSVGYPVGIKKIHWSEPTFAFEDRIYNFLPDKCSFFKIKNIFSSTKYYFYNIENSNPILLNGENKGIIDPVAYKRILETDLIKKLNDLSKSNFLAWLMRPKVLLIVIVAILVIYYFASGHTLQGASNSITQTAQGLSK